MRAGDASADAHQSPFALSLSKGLRYRSAVSPTSVRAEVSKHSLCTTLSAIHSVRAEPVEALLQPPPFALSLSKRPIALSLSKGLRYRSTRANRFCVVLKHRGY